MDKLAVEMVEGDGGAVVMGGMDPPPSWDEYLAQFSDKLQPHMVALREHIESSGLLGRTADTICNEHFFRFSDGAEVAFTWRAWGDLMQAVVDKREGYLEYYAQPAAGGAGEGRG